ncbi:MAG: RNA chaperone Hfq [Alphaproteobacteria bacterium]|nr:RNA chaperone Hfq [Alphaproteobacteria bacterium]
MENTEKIFLEKLFEKKLPVTIFLTCNVKLQGTIKSMDENTVLLEHEGRLQLIYKHAISSVSAGTYLKEDDIV